MALPAYIRALSGLAGFFLRFPESPNLLLRKQVCVVRSDVIPTSFSGGARRALTVLENNCHMSIRLVKWKYLSCRIGNEETFLTSEMQQQLEQH